MSVCVCVVPSSWSRFRVLFVNLPDSTDRCYMMCVLHTDTYMHLTHAVPVTTTDRWPPLTSEHHWPLTSEHHWPLTSEQWAVCSRVYWLTLSFVRSWVMSCKQCCLFEYWDELWSNAGLCLSVDLICDWRLLLLYSCVSSWVSQWTRWLGIDSAES